MRQAICVYAKLLRTVFSSAILTFSFVITPAAGGNAIATLITAENAAQHIQNGPDAIGGIGDWALSNGTVCVIIAGLGNEGDFSPNGGTIRDIGFCGRDDDQFVSQQDLLDGSLGQPVHITDIRADTDSAGNRAAITTLGQYRGVMIETRYTMSDADTAETARIAVSKKIWRHDEEAANPGILATASLNYHSMQTFLMNTRDPQRSNGYAQEKFVGRSILAYTDAARPVDTVMMMSPHDAARPVSYAMRQISATLKSGGKERPLPSFILSDSSALASLTLVEPFTIGDGSSLGLVQLLQVPFMGLALGDEIHLREEILVAASADVQPFTDMLFADAPLMRGRVNTDAPLRVHIDLPDGTPFTQTTPDKDGRFAARLPVGDYRLRILPVAGDVMTQGFSVTENGVDLAMINVPGAARITLPRGQAMRLAFRGIGETQNPHFEDTLTGYSVSDGDGMIEQHRVSDVHLTGAPSDPKHIHLPAGTYQVYGVRGPEFEVTSTTLKVEKGKDDRLKVTAPKRVLVTNGDIAADFHVHSAPSLDNSFSSVKRVRTFVAEHGEVMVAAEHDTIFDFGPLVEKMQLSDKMIAITGSEVTSTQQTDRAPYSIGHMNFFPLKAKPHIHKRGVPNHENRRTRHVLHDMHVHFDDPVAQLNHPRDNFSLTGKTLPDDYEELIGDEMFFDHMGVAAHPYNPHRPLTEAPNSSLIEPDPITGTRDIDFDVMEIMNGTQDYRPERTPASRQDWLSLVAQGEKIAASANSDSHNKWQQVALPRNMVRVDRDTIAGFSLRRFTKAVKQGAFYGTTGPFIELALGTAQMGQTHTGKKAILKGRIYSADWAKADEMRVQVNGKTVKTLTLSGDGRFEIPLVFTADSFVTIEAEGAASETYKAVYPGFFPYAYSNPIYIDANGDGTWTPPGLYDSNESNDG